MNWYSGDITECIKEVKTKNKPLLVLSRGSNDISHEVCSMFDADKVTRHCQDMICLQLLSGSVPFQQFGSFFEVPSLPCIHVISPTGSVLAVKAADFSEKQVESFLVESAALFGESPNNIRKEEDYDICPNAHTPTLSSSLSLQSDCYMPAGKEHFQRQSENADVTENRHIKKTLVKDLLNHSSEPEATISASKPNLNSDSTKNTGYTSHQLSKEEDGSTKLTTLRVSHSPQTSDCLFKDNNNFCRQSDQEVEESFGNALSNSTGSFLRPDVSQRNRVDYARGSLEEEQSAKIVDSHLEDRESELNLCNLGQNSAEFKQLKHEQEIRERLQDQKLEKAENQALRRLILAQIKRDRQEHFDVNGLKVDFPKPFTVPSIPVDSTEVRLQLRLPDGAYMVGVFAAEARLGSEVRRYIVSRVQASPNEEVVAPLSDAARASFALVLATGFTFRQTRPSPPRHFSIEDETTKTLLELELWPSAVLMLHCNKSKPDVGRSVTVYSHNLLWGGVRGVGVVISFLGGGLIRLGHRVWQTIFGNGIRGRVVNRPPPTTFASNQSSLTADEKENLSAYRRQGKITRLSHMPDDTDEQARWNGNSTTQL